MRAWTLLAAFALVALAYGEDMYALDVQGLQVFSIPEKLMPVFKASGNPTSPIRRGSECTSSLLQYCRHEFNTMLNITTDADWTDPQTLYYLVNKIYSKGLDAGVLPICQARSKFYNCLGSAYPTCVSRINLVGRGFSDYNATLYVQIMKNLEFECDGGAIQTTQSYDCIQTVRKSAAYNTSYTKCMQNFNKVTNHGTDGSKFCIGGQMLAECLTPLFGSCRKDVTWWDCELIRNSFQIDDYCPNFNCDYTIHPNTNGNGGHAMVKKSKAQMVQESFDQSGRASIYERASKSALKRA